MLRLQRRVRLWELLPENKRYSTVTIHTLLKIYRLRYKNNTKVRNLYQWRYFGISNMIWFLQNYVIFEILLTGVWIVTFHSGKSSFRINSTARISSAPRKSLTNPIPHIRKMLRRQMEKKSPIWICFVAKYKTTLSIRKFAARIISQTPVGKR